MPSQDIIIHLNRENNTKKRYDVGNPWAYHRRNKYPKEIQVQTPPYAVQDLRRQRLNIYHLHLFQRTQFVKNFYKVGNL